VKLHRLDLPTLTVETAWRAYLAHRDTDRISAVLALAKHFERIDGRAIGKGLRCFMERNELDHRARGKVR
jgi:hypothetical protein